MNEKMTQENTQTENTELETNPETEEVVEQQPEEGAAPDESNAESTEPSQEEGKTETTDSTVVPDEYYSKLNQVQAPVETGGFQYQEPTDKDFEQFKQFQARQEIERKMVVEQAKNNDFVTKLNIASATIPGFKEKVVYNPLFVDGNKNINEFGTQVAHFVKDMENPIPILNYSGNEGKEDFEKIKNLRGYQLAKALADIEDKINTKMKPKKVSQAPKPIEPVKNSGTDVMTPDLSDPKLSYKERKAIRKQQKK